MGNFFEDKLWRVEKGKNFAAGLYVNPNGIICDAAPVLRWSINKKMKWFKKYCFKRGWKLQCLG